MTVPCSWPVGKVAVQPAGTDKSSAPQGVRHQVYQYLVSNSPEVADQSDASPIYDSLNGAYAALKLPATNARS